MDGHKLVESLVELTGLPEVAANNELIRLIENSGVALESLTINDVREILANYLQDVLIEAKRELALNFND